MILKHSLVCLHNYRLTSCIAIQQRQYRQMNSRHRPTQQPEKALYMYLYISRPIYNKLNREIIQNTYQDHLYKKYCSLTNKQNTVVLTMIMIIRGRPICTHTN